MRKTKRSVHRLAPWQFRGDARRTRRASIKMVLLFIRETTGLPPHESACPVVARLPCGRHAPTGRESPLSYSHGRTVQRTRTLAPTDHALSRGPERSGKEGHRRAQLLRPADVDGDLVIGSWRSR